MDGAVAGASFESRSASSDLPKHHCSAVIDLQRLMREDMFIFSELDR